MSEGLGKKAYKVTRFDWISLLFFFAWWTKKKKQTACRLVDKWIHIPLVKGAKLNSDCKIWVCFGKKKVNNLLLAFKKISWVLIWGPFVPATQQSSHITDFQKCTVCFNIQAKCTESSETQELSVGPGEKVQQESSSMGGRAPGYPNWPDPHFQMVWRMLPPDWAQKCFVLLSWIRKQ